MENKEITPYGLSGKFDYMKYQNLFNLMYNEHGLILLDSDMDEIIREVQKLNLTSRQILEYEVHSHWLSGLINFNWGQELLAWYFARKVARKYRRYLKSMDIRIVNKK
jgi:hypothetical protein